MLSTIAQQYKKEGYFIAQNLLPIPLLQACLYEMDVILVQQLTYLGCKVNADATVASVHEHMRMIYAKDQFIYLQAIKLWAKLFSLQALIMHESILKMTKLLDIALPIFQTAPVVHVMANDLKITDGYHGVGVHQDWPALQSGLDTITIWFPFMDIDKNNFPVELIPGSHRQGLYPGKAAQNIYEIDSTSYQEENFIPMEVNYGDVLFMSNFTLHRTSLKGDHRLRIAGSARYENASEKTFIERTYPSAQKRVIQRELIQPDFPDKTLLEEVYPA